MHNKPEKHPIDYAAVLVSAFALFATCVNAWSAYSSFHLNHQTQEMAFFTQLQQQYRSISTRFPTHYRDPDFRAAPGSEDYSIMDQYWQFCYLEWFATNKLQPTLYEDLWVKYYSHRITHALGVQSLRAVLINRMATDRDPDPVTSEFYAALLQLAKDSGMPILPRATSNAKPL